MAVSARSAVVTGGTGFIGSRLVRRLCGDGGEVTVLAQAGSSLDQLGDVAARVRIVRIGAAADSDAVALAVADAFGPTAPDVVFSLAAFRARTTLREVADMADAMVRLPALLIAACVEHDAAFVASASYLLGRNGTPPSSFAALRGGIDPLMDWAVHHHRLRCATLALTSVYGPGDARAKLVPTLCHAAASGSPVELVAPDRRLDLVHVEDVVDAYLAAARHLEAASADAGSRWDVSSGALTTLSELVAIVEHAAGGTIDARWGERATIPSDDIEPARNPRWVPAWSPVRPLTDGIAETMREAAVADSAV